MGGVFSDRTVKQYLNHGFENSPFPRFEKNARAKGSQRDLSFALSQFNLDLSS
jgi:hypothetical protein